MKHRGSRANTLAAPKNRGYKSINCCRQQKGQHLRPVTATPPAAEPPTTEPPAAEPPNGATAPAAPLDTPETAETSPEGTTTAKPDDEVAGSTATGGATTAVVHYNQPKHFQEALETLT